MVVLLAGLLSKLMLLAKIFLEDPPVDLGKSSGMILLLVETDVRSDLEAVTINTKKVLVLKGNHKLPCLQFSSLPHKPGNCLEQDVPEGHLEQAFPCLYISPLM